MDDSTFEALKVKIEGWMKWWKETLGLGNWRVDGVFCRDSRDYPIHRDDGYLSLAVCDTMWYRMEATITFNVPAMAGLADKRLEQLVVHELMHIFLNEMREGDIEHEERVATMLQWAFVWLREAVRGEPAAAEPPPDV